MTGPLDLTNPQHFELYSLHSVDAQYINLCDALLTQGTHESDPERTTDTWHTLIGIGFQLSNTNIAFPALLSKRVNVRAAIDESCWFARGETNIATLGSKIWNEWADEEGENGPIYGFQYRNWPDIKVFNTVEGMIEQHIPPAMIERISKEINRMKAQGYIETALPDGRVLYEGYIDQYADALRQIMARSRSRRIRVQAFNPGYVGMQSLPPCHTEFEFNVTKATAYEIAQMEARSMRPDADSLHIVVTMRSNDALLGRPFNIVGYSAMHQLFAKWAGLNVGSFTLNVTNMHMYDHHREAYAQQREQWLELQTQMQTTGKPVVYPTLEITDDILGLTPEELLDNVNVDWFELVDYSPKPAVKGRVTK
ncbi:hypothetical protein pEaSNUABM34_00047 [Erwinia phage pEa_SNUABM_34]|uniref:thymidylate synthase n=1 Tax=Erwinia phage pEa_SNUABM_7 TaxID=2866695 RepID=A0AAE7WT60_9CAUD|nr:hypothetical protein MPK74_gp047 [Erwinia phage pEa_SNUABM_7]QYW03349.1 hypothetical protein pEaSNUABM34_00047 [Erwinia phage pEa_SNUABM_34]QYW04715.1 hypothetical protein pEaSNUABM7_00047 [Erwinia phage pEa_SNUABM_7]